MIQHRYSEKSLSKLNTCHPIIVRTMKRVLLISRLDIGITCGIRTQAEQQKEFAEGNSTLDGVNDLSMHQPFHPEDFDLPQLSKAVDFLVYPSPYSGEAKDLERYAVVWGIIFTIGLEECEIYKNQTGIKYILIWGGDWNNNGNLKDQKFYDLYHWELKRV